MPSSRGNQDRTPVMVKNRMYSVMKHPCLNLPTALTIMTGCAVLPTPPQLTLADSLLDYFSNVLNAQDHRLLYVQYM